MRTSERNWLIQRDLERYTKFAGGAVAPKIKYLQFSDTLLIWLSAQPEAPEGLQEPAQLVQSISYAASLTLASFISAGIPLRGAVGFGAVFVSTEPLFFTGKELYETIMLERQQAWAGAALHASAMAVLEKESIEPFCLDYDVPMSHKLAIAPTVAVDWVTPISQSPDLVPPWSRMFPEPREIKVRRKAEETQRFFDTVALMQRPFPLRFGEKTINEMRSRVGRLFQ